MSRSQRDLRTVGNRCCLRHPFYGAFVRETQTKTICNHAACHNRQVCVFLSVAMPAISLTGLMAPAAASHATLSSTWEPASLPHREKALTLSRPAFPLWRSEWNTVCAVCVFVDALPQVDKVPPSLPTFLRIFITNECQILSKSISTLIIWSWIFFLFSP